jgi:1,4-alpha-glucan branching enzyme
VQDLVRALNRLYLQEPALWERDFDWSGFRWLDCDDADNSVLSFLRLTADGGRMLACVANLTPVVRHGYRVGVPAPGRWREVLNTDASELGGSGVGNGDLEAEAVPWGSQPFSVALTLPPLGVLWLVPENQGQVG